MKMTETEQRKCSNRCAEFGDPPCFDEAVCGPDIEPCEKCADEPEKGDTK